MWWWWSDRCCTHWHGSTNKQCRCRITRAEHTMFDARRRDCVQCRHPLMLHAAPAPAVQVVSAPAIAVRPPRAAAAAAAAAAASTSAAEEAAAAASPDTGDVVLLHP